MVFDWEVELIEQPTTLVIRSECYNVNQHNRFRFASLLSGSSEFSATSVQFSSFSGKKRFS